MIMPVQLYAKSYCHEVVLLRASRQYNLYSASPSVVSIRMHFDDLGSLNQAEVFDVAARVPLIRLRRRQLSSFGDSATVLFVWALLCRPRARTGRHKARRAFMASCSGWSSSRTSAASSSGEGTLQMPLEMLAMRPQSAARISGTRASTDWTSLEDVCIALHSPSRSGSPSTVRPTATPPARSLSSARNWKPSAPAMMPRLAATPMSTLMTSRLRATDGQSCCADVDDEMRRYMNGQAGEW